MKLKVTVDAAYAFDMLAIAQIKAEKIDSIDANWRFQDLENEIRHQISEELFYKIILSKEYTEVYNANLIVWEMVRDSRDNKVTAQEVDNANYDRHIKKMSLQHKFFNSELTEEKKRD